MINEPAYKSSYIRQFRHKLNILNTIPTDNKHSKINNIRESLNLSNILKLLAISFVHLPFNSFQLSLFLGSNMNFKENVIFLVKNIHTRIFAKEIVIKDSSFLKLFGSSCYLIFSHIRNQKINALNMCNLYASRINVLNFIDKKTKNLKDYISCFGFTLSSMLIFPYLSLVMIKDYPRLTSFQKIPFILNENYTTSYSSNKLFLRNIALYSLLDGTILFFIHIKLMNFIINYIYKEGNNSDHEDCNKLVNNQVSSSPILTNIFMLNNSNSYQLKYDPQDLLLPMFLSNILLSNIYLPLDYFLINSVKENVSFSQIRNKFLSKLSYNEIAKSLGYNSIRLMFLNSLLIISWNINK